MVVTANTTKYTIEKDLTKKIECEPMPNVMVALPNIGDALSLIHI